MKLCIVCNNPVETTKHKNQKYCSRVCYYKGRFPNQRITTICQQCGVGFWYYASRGSAKFCSLACYTQSPTFRKNRQSQKPLGENHWNWKGGVMKGRKDRNLGVYKNWRKEVFERDNYTCQHCSRRGGWLEADHIKAWVDYPELRYETANGRTLCRPCHIARTATQLSERMRRVTI